MKVSNTAMKQIQIDGSKFTIIRRRGLCADCYSRDGNDCPLYVIDSTEYIVSVCDNFKDSDHKK